MRTKTTKTVQVEVTTYTCDFCSFAVDSQARVFGGAPVIACHVCERDACREHRIAYFDDPGSDYADAVICTECQPVFDAAWQRADAVAGRHDSRLEVAMRLLTPNVGIEPPRSGRLE